MFVREEIEINPSTAIVRKSEGNGAASKARAWHPFEYKRVEIMEDTLFVGGSSDCQGMGCIADKNRIVIGHKASNIPQSFILDKVKEFPPRQG